MQCSNCGASFLENATLCEYCGTLRPVDRTADPRSPDNSDIFRRIRESPQFTERKRTSRRNRVPQIDSMPAVVVGVYLVFGGVAVVLSTKNLFEVGGVWGFVPVITVVFGVLLFLFFPAKSERISGGNLDCQPAIVLGKRTEVRGGRYASTSYYVTFEFEEGKRRELSVHDGRLFGQISEGDAGVLYLRGRDDVGAAFITGRYVADFERVRF